MKSSKVVATRLVGLGVLLVLAVAVAGGCDGSARAQWPATGNPNGGDSADAGASPAVDAPPEDGDAGEPGRPPEGPPELGANCETASGEMLACADGLLCCKPCCDGRPAVCTPPVQNEADIGTGKCPLPDLTVSATALRESVGFGPVTYAPSSCEAREQCIDGPGLRNTLHFDVTTPNIGSADLVLGSPLTAHTDLGSGFLFSRCHDHYHFDGYALYQLFDAAGTEVLQGRKRAFCLEDAGRIPGSAFPLPRPMAPRYTCSFQGISMGWADTYANGLTCQYIDVTGIPPGRYRLRVTVNPSKIFTELSYDNNSAEAMVDIPAPAAVPTDPCLGLVSHTNRECGWTMEGSRTCAPGARVSVGCGAECGLGTSDGDPMMRVCEGSGPCTWPGLGVNDDCSPGPGSGSRVNFVCPPSGRYTVLTGPYSSSDEVKCNVEAR